MKNIKSLLKVTSNHLFLGIVILFLVIVVSGLSYAQELPKESPKEKLTLFENIRLMFSFTPEAKAKVYLNIAQTRLERAFFVNGTDLIEEAKLYTMRAENIGKTISNLAKQQKLSNDTTKLSEKVLEIVRTRNKQKRTIIESIRNKDIVRFNTGQEYHSIMLKKDFKCSNNVTILTNPDDCIKFDEKRNVFRNNCIKSVMIEIVC